MKSPEAEVSPKAK